MGTFFFMTAVRTTAAKRVEEALAEAAEQEGFEVHLKKPARFDDWMAFALQRGAWTCVQYQHAALDWIDTTRRLSSRLKSPAFFFQIYDGDVWGWWFFEAGRDVAKFVSIQEAYDEAVDDPKGWTGRIELVVERLGLKDVALLREYLAPLDPDLVPAGKVRPDDRFDRADVWVMADFLRRLGIAWEDPEQGGSTLYLERRR